MKNLSMILSVLFLSVLTAAPAVPLSYEFDFNGDEAWDENLNLSGGKLAPVKIWLDGYSCPPDDLLFAVQLYVSFNNNKVRVAGVFANDTAHGGPFDQSFSGFIERRDNRIYFLYAARIDYVNVIGNKILLGTIILEATFPGNTTIKATDKVGDEYLDDGFVSDCDLKQQYPDDAEAVISISGSGCVVESVYGEQSGVTETLRKYRDNILSHIPEGRELINLYYLWSPVIVKAIEQDEEFKEEIKEMIDGVLPMIENAMK